MTLKDRISGRAVHGANSGPNLCLNNSEEIALTKNSASWIWHKSKEAIQLVEKAAKDKDVINPDRKVSQSW